MIRPRVTRALNPHKRRNLSIAQIRAGFGGKRRRASLRASKQHHHKRRAKAKTANPKRRKRATAKARTKTKVVYRNRYKTRTVTKKVYVAKPRRKARRKANAKHRRRSNPGPLLVTLSPVGNPRRRGKRSNMAKHRRKVSARGRSGKRRNPTRRRRHHVVRHRVHHRTRNPFGESTPQLIKDGFGVFIGFSLGKKIPPMFGPTANSSPMMSLASTAAVAALAAWAANTVGALRPLARGVLWGGAAAVINVAWNAWAPASLGGYLGVGDFVAGGFPLPQGPVRYPMALPGVTPTGSQVDIGAFGQAFTRAW